MRRTRHAIVKWLTPGLRVKRWLVVLLVGITLLALGLAQAIVALYRAGTCRPLYVACVYDLGARAGICGGCGRDRHRRFCES